MQHNGAFVISRSRFEQYDNAVKAIQSAAEQELQKFWNALDKSDPIKAKEAILAYVPALVYSYGNAAATVAADFYDAERSKQIKNNNYVAEVKSPEYEEIENRCRYVVGYLFGGDSDE